MLICTPSKDVAIGQRATKARYGAACSKSKVVLTSFQLGIRPTGNGDSAIFVGKQARSFTYLELLHYLLTVRTSGSSEVSGNINFSCRYAFYILTVKPV